MKKVVLLLSYQGTSYSGWQRQPNALSIQEVIESCLAKVAKKPLALSSSGRTDAGVHAYGQVAHFLQPDHPSFSNPKDIKKMLNAILPHDIVIRDVVLTDDHFHSRFTACAKEYRYTLTRAAKALPWHRNLVYAPRHKLDANLMRAGANYLLGTHDFASFANLGRDYTSTVRTLFKLDILEEGDLITVVCQGNGFLYKMVRNILGALLDVSRGKYPPEHLQEILEQKSRRKGPAAAPAYGLCLHHVCYPHPYDWFCSSLCNSSKE